MADPSQYHALTAEEADKVREITSFTEEYFRDPKFDASHDFKHVLRVTALAIRILEKEQELRQKNGQHRLDAFVVVLGALLHDVDDQKYRATDSQAVAVIEDQLLRHGVDQMRAAKVQALVDGVSYRSEIKNPQKVRDLLVTVPELAVVQDADRLDAIGAVGVGRCFAYGAAKTSRDLAGSVDHFDEKLLKLEHMTKTEAGRALASRYADRLRQFRAWWQEEIEFAGNFA